MSQRFRPQRSFRSELKSLAVVAAVPCLLILVFPADALHPLPSPAEPASNPSCAFVTLTPVQEARALASARTAWQRDRKTRRQMRINIFADSLPSLPQRPILDRPSRTYDRPLASKPYEPNLLPPTLAAPPPEKIAPQPDEDKAVPTFSREELLKLN